MTNNGGSTTLVNIRNGETYLLVTKASFVPLLLFVVLPGTIFFFSRYGKVEDAVVMYDKKTGRSRGFGFITYDNPDVVRKVR